MKFTVKALRNSGRARVGSLEISNGTLIETPALALSTRKGLPHFIAPDLLASLPHPDSHLLHLSPLHFLECPSPKTISSMGGVHKMVGLPNYCFAAAPRDSLLCLPVCETTNKMGASFESPCGRRLVKPVDYMEMISSLKPNLWASVADEVPVWVSKKRNTTSVDRTVRWLDECLSLDPEGGSYALGAIVGGSDVEERTRCAKEVAMRHVSGYWLGGFGLGESAEERPTLLNAVIDVLPKEKPRQICGLGLPEEVLQGVASGVDIFDSTYIYHVTIGGYGLVFPRNRDERYISEFDWRETEGDMTKINLRATVYRDDRLPILEKCPCYTCKNHTRAYIHHLLNVHEMLAQILLEIHNTHHYLGFFRWIREAIKRGEFEDLYERFVEVRREHLAVAVAVAVAVAC